MRFKATAITATILALCVGGANAEQLGASPACQAVRDMLRIDRARAVRSGEAKQPWVFADVDAQEANSYLGRVPVLGWRHPPATSLVARFRSADTKGPLADCEGFGSFVTSLGGHFGKAAEDEATRARTNPALRAALFVEMSTPEVSADGSRALVYVDNSCGVTCGAGFILHLARQPNGEWRVLDRLGLWIS